MRWRNDPGHFGLISRGLHWIMAIFVLGQLALGSRLPGLAPGLANLWLYSLHKSLGFLVLALLLCRLAWHCISPPPPPIGPSAVLVNRAARLVHRLIYLGLLAIPLTGWIASSATGIDVMILDRWTVPAIAPVSESWEKAFFALHGVLTKALMLLLLAHLGGAALRGAKGDGTLRRMIRG